MWKKKFYSLKKISFWNIIEDEHLKKRCGDDPENESCSVQKIVNVDEDGDLIVARRTSKFEIFIGH